MFHMLRALIQDQKNWSRETFGDGHRVEGICRHIEKELAEVRESNGSLDEWVDVFILAMEGMWRTGASAPECVDAVVSKMIHNQQRKWPKPTSEDEPKEHIRD